MKTTQVKLVKYKTKVKSLKNAIKGLEADKSSAEAILKELRTTFVELAQENILLRAKASQFSNSQELSFGIEQATKLIAKSKEKSKTSAITRSTEKPLAQSGVNPVEKPVAQPAVKPLAKPGTKSPRKSTKGVAKPPASPNEKALNSASQQKILDEVDELRKTLTLRRELYESTQKKPPLSISQKSVKTGLSSMAFSRSSKFQTRMKTPLNSSKSRKSPHCSTSTPKPKLNFKFP